MTCVRVAIGVLASLGLGSLSCGRRSVCYALKAWVVKLLGGLSASARAQRTFDSLVWGPCLVVGALGDTVKAWVVKLLGGLSASACAQRTSDSLVWGPCQVVGARVKH